MNRKLIIGTRGSALALWQAHFTQHALSQLGYEVELQIIKTQGDLIQLSFSKIEGKGFFTKEIEQALLDASIDLAVHSHKDLPTESNEQLVVVANSYRDNPTDWLLINPKSVDQSLPLHLKQGARIGTSSSRRKSQLLALRPDLVFVDIRGNVATRLAKALTEVDAVVLAAAGISRLQLDLSSYHRYELSPQQCIPAPAQGVLAFQIRQNDTSTHQIVAQLHDPAVAECIAIERNILQQLGGGCQQPIGVYAEKKAEQFHVWANYSTAWNDFPRRVYRHHHQTQHLIAQVVADLLCHKKTAIFISRPLATDSYTYSILQSKYTHVFAQSLIHFTPVPITHLPNVDWVFFSSSKGAQHFFEQRPNLPQHLRYAAIGAATAETLQQYGYSCEFVGDNTSSPAHIAQAFGNIAQQQRVLFPQAQQSLRSIQQHLSPAHHIDIVDLVVYDNQALTQFELPECDTLAFTSPMNVDTYCRFYPILPHQKVIAIGKTTAAALQKNNCHHYTIALTPDELALVDAC